MANFFLKKSEPDPTDGTIMFQSAANFLNEVTLRHCQLRDDRALIFLTSMIVLARIFFFDTRGYEGHEVHAKNEVDEDEEVSALISSREISSALKR